MSVTIVTMIDNTVFLRIEASIFNKVTELWLVNEGGLYSRAACIFKSLLHPSVLQRDIPFC